MPRRKLPPSGFGARLVALRKAKGLTQVQLADAIASSQRAISYYENHATHPTADVVIALAKALGVTTDELLGVDRLAPRAARTGDGGQLADAEDRRLWRTLRKVQDLPEKDQRAVLRLISSLAAASGAT